MGRKNLVEILNPQKEKSVKNSSGVTASTTFGSGISGTDNDWPKKNINSNPVNEKERISPELKV